MRLPLDMIAEMISQRAEIAKIENGQEKKPEEKAFTGDMGAAMAKALLNKRRTK